MSRSFTNEKQIHPFDALATIGCIYLGLITFGFAAFRYLAVLPLGASRNQDRTFFTSVNAVSLTGFSQGNAAVENYPTLGLIVLGFLALASALTTLIGGAYLFARVLGWRTSLPCMVGWAAAILIVPIGCLAYFGGFDAVSAATGLGLSARRSPAPFQTVASVALSTFGMLGVIPLIEFFAPKRDRGDERGYVSWTIVVIALLVVGGIVLLLLCGSPWTATANQSLALRAFGNTGVRVDVTSATPWAVACLAVVGAAPAGTAGGLGVFPLVVLLRGAIDLLRSRAVDRLVGVAVAWIVAFALCAAAAVIGLAASAPALPGDRIIVLAFAALGNVGVSHEAIGLTGNSLFILSAAMLVGRLLPLVMLAWMACVREQSANG